MKEAQEKIRRRHESTVGFENLIKGVINGDQEAVENLDSIMSTQYAGRFYSFGERGQELLQDFKFKVFSNLNSFDPTLSQHKSFDIAFKSWLSVIARNTAITEVRAQNRKPKEEEFVDSKFTPKNDGKETNDIDYETLLKNRVNEIMNKFPLRESQKLIVNLVLENKSFDEISEILKSSKASIKVRLSGARRVLEQELLFPAGLRLISSYARDEEDLKRIVHAANKKRLGTIKFLGLRYTTQEQIDMFKKQELNRQTVPENMLPLSKHVTTREYYYIRKNHETIKINGIYYISKEGLEKARSNLKPRRQKIHRTINSPDGYKPISEIIKYQSEYQVLASSIRRHKLHALKAGRLLVVRQEEAIELLKRRNPNPEANPEETF